MDDFDDGDGMDATDEPGPADGLLPPWTAGENLWAFVQWSDDPGDDPDDDDA